MDIQFLLLPLVLLAAAWIIYYGLPNYSKLKAKIGELSASVDAANDQVAAFGTPAAFAAGFDRCDRAIAGLPLIGPAWRYYARTLVVFEEEVLAPRSASDFFNLGLLERADVDFRRYDAVPNQLIGYGLMFTFLGLVATLFVATPGLRGDADAAKQALEGLLIAAGSKFITSVVAIFASLQFTVRKNALLHDVDVVLEALCARIDALVPPISAEELGRDTQRELERQSAMLAERNVEMASAVATQLDATLRANLPSAFQPIVAEMQRISTDIHRINEATMKDMVERFIQELGVSVQAHTRSMTGMLEQVTATVEAMPRQIGAAGDRFEQVFNAVTVRIQSTLDGSATALETLLGKAGENVGASGVALEQIAERLREMLDRVQAATAALSARTERIDAQATAALAELAAGARQVAAATDALAPLATLGTGLAGLTGQLIAVTEGMAAFAETGRLTVVEARRAVESLDGNARGFNESVASLDASLDGVFRKLADGIDTYRDHVGKAVASIDYDLGTATERLSDVVGRLDQAGK